MLVLLTFNCSSDDDSTSNPATVQALLTSGKWYQESKTPGSYTDCEKLSYVQFLSDGTFNLESFEDDEGDCSSIVLITATYTLANNMTIIIDFEGDLISVEIVSISENLLTLTSSENETLVFDKTAG
jgi:hypothetical protein